MEEKRLLDVESLQRIRGAFNRFSEVLHYISNEASLGLFRVEEHVRKSVPQIAQKKRDLRNVCKRVEEKEYDLGFSLMSLKKATRSVHFESCKKLLGKCVNIIEPGSYETPVATPLVVHTSLKSEEHELENVSVDKEPGRKEELNEEESTHISTELNSSVEVEGTTPPSSMTLPSPISVPVVVSSTRKKGKAKSARRPVINDFQFKPKSFDE